MPDFEKYGNFDYKNPSVKEIRDMIASGQKVVMFYHISKDEVVKKDYRGIGKLLNTVTIVGKGAKRSLVITCNGYDDVVDELWTIDEVREFIGGMFDKYPYLLYYISDFDEEIDKWLLCCLADDIMSVFEGEPMTGNEIWEKYGLDHEKIPKVHANLTFKSNSANENRLIKMLKAIIKHGKINKDVKGGKRIAIEYAMKFDNTERTLSEIDITIEDIKDIMS